MVPKPIFFFFSKKRLLFSRINGILNELTDDKERIEAWLSLVERCVRDAEVASSNLVASMRIIWPVGQAVKTTPSHGVNPGSIPGQVTIKDIGFCQCLFCFPVFPFLFLSSRHIFLSPAHTNISLAVRFCRLRGNQHTRLAAFCHSYLMQSVIRDPIKAARRKTWQQERKDGVSK